MLRPKKKYTVYDLRQLKGKRCLTHVHVKSPEEAAAAAAEAGRAAGDSALVPSEILTRGGDSEHAIGEHLGWLNSADSRHTAYKSLDSFAKSLVNIDKELSGR